MLGLTFAKNFLVNDKAPFVVTLFIAASSWTAVRTADRLASIPFVEYRTEPARSEAGVSGIEVRLRNITTASKFECFVLTLATRRHETLKFADPKDQQHRLRGTVFASLTVRKAKPNEWEVEVANLSPGADIALLVPAIGEGHPAVLGSACATVTTISELGVANSADNKARPKAPPDTVPILVLTLPLESVPHSRVTN